MSTRARAAALIASTAIVASLGAIPTEAAPSTPARAPETAHTKTFINSPHSDIRVIVWKDHNCEGQSEQVDRGAAAPWKVGSFWQPKDFKIYFEAGPYNGFSTSRAKKGKCYNAWTASKQVYNLDGPSKGHS
jgi:hypothetical protein